ncbi:tRNA pseudouridine(38-40) synthase TruA [Thermodesulfobacteriota bacterium]
MAAIKNIRLDLQYDGTLYHGWQRQKSDPTIQAVLEDKIQIMTNESVTLHGSGRTDAGVHALNQVCNFNTSSRLDPPALRKGLNSLLPQDIHITDAQYVPSEFHSRYSARAKTYEYRILNRPEPDIFSARYLWHIQDPLKRSEMAKCLSSLLGEQDFSSFMSTGSAAKSPVRNMIGAEIEIHDSHLLSFYFKANGFLRHMVRNIVGSVVEVGRGKTGVDAFEKILLARDRTTAGVKAPPQGLFLVEVKY